MNGFRRRQEEKKDKIFGAALELFSTHGVQNVKITEIAHKAQVSPVTIYNYFASKIGLLRYVICRFMDEQWEEYQRLLEGDTPFPQKIEIIIFNKKKTAQALHPEFIQSVVSKDPEIRKFLEKFYKEKSLPMLMEIIKQGRDEGCIDQDISAETIMFYINMFWEALSRPEFMSEENKSTQMELVNLFFYGLMGKAGE